LADAPSGPGVKNCGVQREFAELVAERHGPIAPRVSANDSNGRGDSPLELKLLAALLDGHFQPLGAASELVVGWGASGLLVRQLPVVSAGRRQYADFAVLAPKRNVYLVVEVDGREFHDLTRAQAENDRQRERRLTAAGWTVVRFAGREVWRDASGCAAELVSICTARGRGGQR
jgi:very-short-patch-repair endonuclease